MTTTTQTVTLPAGLRSEARAGSAPDAYIVCEDCRAWAHSTPTSRLRHSSRCDTRDLQPTWTTPAPTRVPVQTRRASCRCGECPSCEQRHAESGHGDGNYDFY